MKRTSEVAKRSNKQSIHKKRKVPRAQPVVRRTVNLGIGFPEKTLVTHRYVEQITFTNGAAGAIGFYHFSCNGLYDPNITGTGHQPMFFDQLGSIYDHYCVIGSKIRAEFAPVAGMNDLVVAVLINDDATTATNTAVYESNGCKSMLLPYNSPDTHVIEQTWSAKANFGKVVIGNSAYTGTVATNPSEQSYFTITSDSARSATQNTITVRVTIDYITIWSERTKTASS